MATILGPILNLRNVTSETWRLSVLVVTDNGEPGSITWDVAGTTGAAVATPLWTRKGRTAYCFDLPLPRIAIKGVYQYDGISYELAIPGESDDPRIIYVSCNGFSDPKVMAKHSTPQMALWEDIEVRHASQPYHVLIGGGDQVYADSILYDRGDFEAWASQSFQQGNQVPLTAAMDDQLQEFYFDLYCSRWKDPTLARIMASVPLLAMWDDHDIIDGWGSYPRDRQDCPVMKGIFAAARRGFAVFQQHLPSESTTHPNGFGDAFSRGLIIGKTAILALDLRSDRRQDCVMRPSHWKLVVEWLDSLDEDKVKHLLLMSSIPVVYPSFSLLEEMFAIIPGQQELEDDLRDHWNSVPHAQERVRLIHNLINLSYRGIRPTILSGDVHVAALGQIESTRDPARVVTINQLISSAVVHPPPPAIAAFGLGLLFDKLMPVDSRIEAKMMAFPGTRSRMIARRNYMVLEPDNEGRIWANWITEGEPNPYTKVIHSLG